MATSVNRNPVPTLHRGRLYAFFALLSFVVIVVLMATHAGSPGRAPLVKEPFDYNRILWKGMP